MRAFGPALLAGVTMLAGCGQSEAQIRDELRAQMMSRCNRDIAPGTSDLPGFDSAVFCGCVTDKAMGQRSVAELKALFDEASRPQMLAQGRQAATECLAQLSTGGAAETAAPAPEAANNTSTPAPAAAPAPAAERERERERPREKAEPTAPPRPRIEDVRDTPQPSTQPVVPPRAAPPAQPRPAAPTPTPTPPPEPEVRNEKAAPGDRG